jgi:hypothetical protein
MIRTPSCWSEPRQTSRVHRAANSSADTTLRWPVRVAFSYPIAFRRVSGSVMASAAQSRTAKVFEPIAHHDFPIRRAETGGPALWGEVPLTGLVIGWGRRSAPSWH